MKKRYQVFVSSTYKDLIKERLIVKKAILEMQHFPTGMEEFPAIDKPQMEYIKELINESDYYILVLGGKLGSIDSETGKSFTYLEFEYAKEKNIPILAIIKKNENGVECYEKGVRKDKYLAFVSEVENGRLCRYYSNKNELSGIVHLGLNKQIEAYPQSGWIKADIKKNRIEEGLLLRGDIIEEFHIGREIYDITEKYKEFDEISSINQKISIKYGADTQETFKLILFISGHNTAHNFFYDVKEDYFDEDGLLNEDVRMQISFAKLGNTDEILLFFSVGNLLSELETTIYRISNIDIKEIGTIEGQQFMYLDYDIMVPIGSQGIFDSYVYVRGNIYRKTAINEML